MKKVVKYGVIIVVALIAAFVYYYVTIPAFNIHSVGTWWFIIGAVAIVGFAVEGRKIIQEHGSGVEFIK